MEVKKRKKRFLFVLPDGEESNENNEDNEEDVK